MIKICFQFIFLPLMLISFSVQANNQACLIDPWFNQTTRAKNLQLDTDNRHIDRENIWLSQLPSIGVSTSSATSNYDPFDKIFRIKSFPPFVGMSLNLYNGSALNLALSDNDADQKLAELDRASQRNQYLLNLLNNVYNLKNLQYTMRDIDQQIEYLDKNKIVYQFQVNKGERPKIELDIIKNQIKILHVQNKTLKNNYHKSLISIARQFSITDTEIQNLNYTDISQCIYISEIKINTEKLKITKQKKEIAFKRINSSLLPNISLSAGINPAIGNDGSPNYRHSQYQISLSASINLSSAFQLNNDKKQALIRLKQSELSYEDALINFKNDRDNVITSLQNAKLQLQSAQNNMILENRRVEYAKSQYLNGKETFLSYMNEISRLLTEKNRLSQFENQRDYYEALSYFYH